ncbi:winged helix-turn-helix domain-containing protein [Kitasatospora sp. NPDC002227]|uniref:ArsR/SmtB family transcription factor n=1 Tax=Kitasatospora sp. NPDC002227 TaxID=3154773 RepID=UPI00331B5AB0
MTADSPNTDDLTVDSPAQHKALAHPLRQRLLLALSGRSATISQLAVGFDAQKGTVAHHLKVLREAGLVHVAETRQVRGGTEQYYRRTPRRVAMSPTDPAEAGSAVAIFSAVSAEYAAAPREPAPPALTLRHLRLTRAQAARLAAELDALVDGAEEAPEGEPVHGVLVALYERPPL